MSVASFFRRLFGGAGSADGSDKFDSPLAKRIVDSLRNNPADWVIKDNHFAYDTYLVSESRGVALSLPYSDQSSVLVGRSFCGMSYWDKVVLAEAVKEWLAVKMFSGESDVTGDQK